MCLGKKQPDFFESEAEEIESSLKQIARLEGVASLLNTLEKYPTILPMAFITRKITKETRKKKPKKFIKNSKFSLFNQIIDVINNARENWIEEITINCIVIPFDAYSYLKKQFLSTKDLYRFILEGYFSQNDYERFQRVVTYLHMVITWWEYNIDIAQDWLSIDASKGDGWMMEEEEMMHFVWDSLHGEECSFKIAPRLIAGENMESHEFYINYKKIIEEEDYKDQVFIKFMERYFTIEADQALDTRIERRRKLGLEQEFPTNQD